MSRFILRPLLILLTLMMLVVALLQSAGRVTFMFLDELEEPANQWLSARQIQVTGLRGDWHLLNPVVYVDRLEFPGGHVAAVRIEADWLESLLRNRFVVRAAVIGTGFIQLDRRLDGSWGLPGLTGGDQFDPSGLLYHSDQLSASGSVVLSADGTFSEPISVDYLATNRGGVHRHHIRVGNAEENGVAEFRYQVQEALWPLWPERRGVAVSTLR